MTTTTTALQALKQLLAVTDSDDVSHDDAIRMANDGDAYWAAIRDARAALSAPAAQDAPSEQWRPIETAPMDGTDILLSNGVAVAEGRWLHAEPHIREKRDLNGRYIDQDESDGFDGWIDWTGGMLPAPTHWRHLPAVPAHAVQKPAIPHEPPISLLPALTDEELLSALVNARCLGYQRMTRDSGNYDLETPTAQARRLADSIAATFAARASQPATPAQDAWRNAVQQECMAAECCYAEADPVGTVRALIDWHVANAAHPVAGQGQAVCYLSSKQLRDLLANERRWHYIPYSLEREGNFDTPVTLAAPPAPQAPALVPLTDAWCYSFNEETFYGPEGSREAAIAELDDQGGWVGRERPPREFLNAKAIGEHVGEFIGELLTDEIGEAAEHFAIKPADQEALGKAVIGWIEAGPGFNCFGVKDIEPINPDGITPTTKEQQ